MDLLRVQDNLLVNIDKINFIEIKKIQGKQSIIVNVDGKNLVLERPIDEFLKDLHSSGANLTNQFTSL